MAEVTAKNPNEPEFLQAVQEVTDSLAPVLERHPKYREGAVLERMVEPERVIMFRVPWQDDDGEVHVNRGYPRRDEQRDRPVQGRACGSTPRCTWAC